jgi:segregation and condensation protein A
VVSSPFTLRLEKVFQGPLDLLLHLVREQEVEIHEIEINTVVQRYLEYLKAMRELDIELAGDFLVMAATLMSIKSRSLLPREEIDLEKELDPRDELIQRLIEYRRFKEASDQLGQRYALRELSFERGDAGAEAPADEPVLDLGELSSWDLLAAFSRLMRETLGHRPHRVQREARPLRHYVQALATRELVLGLDEEPSRESLIGSFCALLELVKLGLVGVLQPERHGEIRVELKPEHAEEIEGLIRSSVFDDEAPPAAAENSVEAGAEAPEAS